MDKLINKFDFCFSADLARGGISRGFGVDVCITGLVEYLSWFTHANQGLKVPEVLCPKKKRKKKKMCLVMFLFFYFIKQAFRINLKIISKIYLTIILF